MSRPGPNASPYPHLEGHPDSAGATLDFFRANPYRIYVGKDPGSGQLLLADKDSPVLFLGPSSSGKTSSGIIPAILTATAGVVAVSSRDDLYMATALYRARLGPVYSFLSPDLPGADEVRWSPLQGCESWDFAVDFGRRWASYTDTSSAGLAHDSKGQAHFRLWAGTLNAVVAYYAATFGKDIEWVIDFLNGVDFNGQWKDVSKELAADARKNPDSGKAARALRSVLATYAGERSGIISTATMSWAPYTNRVAIESQRNADWDFEQLVVGEPDTPSFVTGAGVPGMALHPVVGRWPTVYITSGDAEDLKTPIILEWLHRAKKAAYKHARAAELAGLPEPLPLKLVLDELKASPITDIPTILAESRQRCLEVVGGIQSLNQAMTIYPEGKDFLSLWRTCVIFRGIKDGETIQLLSTLGGSYFQEMHGYSERDQGGYTGNVSYQERKNFTEAEIAKGHKELPDAAVMLDPRAQMMWQDMTPYYRGEPWCRILINSAEHAYRAGLTRYPLPPLGRYTYEHLDALGLTARMRALLAQQG